VSLRLRRSRSGSLLSDDSLDAVYELAEDSSTLGLVTKEALDVIEAVLDEYV
jgi:hypothetical protein